jgi:hypothetical protein
MNARSNMTDTERAAIEKEIKALMQKANKTAEIVDTSDWLSVLSDEYRLGFIDDGEFYMSAKDITGAFTEGFCLLDHQETLETPQSRLAVLAPDIAVMTDLQKVMVYYKDGKTYTGNFAHTTILVKLDGTWKLIHMHQSVQKAE